MTPLKRFYPPHQMFSDQRLDINSCKLVHQQLQIIHSCKLVLLGQLLRRNILLLGRRHELLLLLLLSFHILEEGGFLVNKPNICRKQKHVQKPEDLQKKKNTWYTKLTDSNTQKCESPAINERKQHSNDMRQHSLIGTLTICCKEALTSCYKLSTTDGQTRFWNPHMETCRHTKNFNSKLKISG